uniref:N-alpha-acetyltransferase 60 n=1 Tax=Dunaliella tertiolecta TaxID=3047 RepID=A0A7S3R8Z6_DUNTE|mmetsp:Transcript_28682/g.77318  ORF Transcript_28682/g.77318 Transcript_28682/m.77318 type:complete len:412 (-) Transcript_28682:749-1984(-)|eukprot:CAMPEP_0202366014 /NCGR_PEP_ID=MMETSP1126-20121109/16802_1 /ASSEMBLY_ACC=CAM_ASM_000457 /TAXON_ID=3047 /ORGANISM="Dunaliella tertiolecta, Strain CCMP1320" /LENGTH=411 /DNA_ID=CAMNT_0048960993 /DNA_START=9 /DNA_END=1244 /DNA_ORIENTATION=+
MSHYLAPLPASNLTYRPLQPGDFVAVKEAHLQLFPIKYEDTFFNKAVNSLDRIFSFAAFENANGDGELAGFITARLCFMYELDNVDRFHISQSNPNNGSGTCASTDPAVYILTLGVVPSWQKCGVASSLLALARQHAIEQLRCCVMYLHVISYNEAAISLYMRNQFQCLGLLKDFYSLPCGPQPNAARALYDAYLFVQYLPFNLLADATYMGSQLQSSSKSSWLAPVAQVSNGLGSMLGFGSMWQAWGQVNSCIPWLSPRQPSPALQPPAPLQHNQQQNGQVTAPHALAEGHMAAPLHQQHLTAAAPEPHVLADGQMAAPHVHGVSSTGAHTLGVQQHASLNTPPEPALQGQVPQAMLQQQHSPAQYQQHKHQQPLQKHQWQQDGHGNRIGASKSFNQTPSLFQWFTSPPR